MKKYFDIEEAINCIKNDIPVTRIDRDGAVEVWSMENGKLKATVDGEEFATDYLDELVNCKEWTYYEANNK